MPRKPKMQGYTNPDSGARFFICFSDACVGPVCGENPHFRVAVL